MSRWNLSSSSGEDSVFSLFCYNILSGDITPIFKKLEFPLSKNTLCPDWFKLAQKFYRKNISLFLAIIFQWSKAWHFFWIHLISLNPSMLCVKYGKIDLVLLENIVFLNFINLFYYSINFSISSMYFRFLFGRHLFLEKGSTLYLDKLESPLSKHFCAKFGWYWPSDFCEDEKVKN